MEHGESQSFDITSLIKLNAKLGFVTKGLEIRGLDEYDFIDVFDMRLVAGSALQKSRGEWNILPIPARVYACVARLPRVQEHCRVLVSSCEGPRSGGNTLLSRIPLQEGRIPRTPRRPLWHWSECRVVWRLPLGQSPDHRLDS